MSFVRRGLDGLEFSISGSPASTSEKGWACFVRARTVWVTISGEALGEYSLTIEVPGQELVTASDSNVSFRDFSAKALLAMKIGRTCKIKRNADKATNRSAQTISGASATLLAAGQMRPLPEVFEEFMVEHLNGENKNARITSRTDLHARAEEMADFESVSVHLTGEENFRLEFRKGLLPSTVSLRRMQSAAQVVLAVVVAHPAHDFKIERKKPKNVVTVQGKQLVTANGELRPLSEVFEVAYQARNKAKSVFQPKNEPWRICFQLESPSDSRTGETTPNSDWQIRVLFQSTTDLSLLVPLRETTGFNAAKYVGKLKLAAGRFPLLDRWIEHGTPSHFITKLTIEEVVNFLETEAPDLERAGFAFRLPSWMHNRGASNRLNLVARTIETAGREPGQLSLAGVMEVNWDVCLGEDCLTVEEINTIARLKIPLLQMRGKWVYVNAGEIEALVHLLRDGLRGSLSTPELIRFAADQTNAYGLPVRKVLLAGRSQFALEAVAGKFEELPQPSGLQATLRPYQQRGFSWLTFMANAGLGACLADDMGLGKTVQVLAFLQHQWQCGNRQPALLVCPTSLLENWRREARRFTPELRVDVHHGEGRASKAGEFFVRFQGHALVITSYSLLARDADIFVRTKWAGLFLDEAQNIKNPNTQQASTARSLIVPYRIALTGTPIENTVADLWAIMEFLNPGYLGSRKEFEEQFLAPLKGEDAQVTLERLRQLTRPFVLRRLKTDPDVCPDLPEKIESKVYCPLTGEQATLYAAVLRDEWDTVAHGAGGTRGSSILRLIVHLKQVCNHPAQYLKDRSELNVNMSERSGKLERVTEILDQVRMNGKAALVFTQYQKMGEMLRQHLATRFGETEVLFLHGGVPVEQRKIMTEKFQAKDGPNIFIRSLKAGGTGETLTRATHVIHFDRWWNPAVENQATDRAHRIGQREVVQVHKLICAGTLEDRIDQMIEHKRTIMGQAVDAGDQWLSGLSTDEIRELVALDEERVG